MKVTYFISYCSAIAILAALPLNAQAEARNQFFDSNVVNDFSVPVRERGGEGFDYFIKREVAKEDAPVAQAAEVPQNAAPAAENITPLAFHSGQDVLKAYGDPSTDTPVLAQESAPKPFKAMMAAFETGDDQLAYQYARQWVRYMGNLQKRTSRVVDAAHAAQMSEKIVSSNAPDADRMRQMIVSDNANLAANLDPKAQAILRQAEADEQHTTKNPQSELEQQELKARQDIRRQLAGKIPVDPQGRVDVYLFLGVNDNDGEKYAKLVNQIYNRTSSMKNVNFAAFSTARLTKDALTRQRQRLRLNFELLVGDSFAKELQLRTTPAVVLVSPTTGKVVKETIDKPFFYYDELIAVMQGR